MKNEPSGFITWIKPGALLLLLILLSSCGAPTRSDSTAGTGTSVIVGSKVPAAIALSTDKASVKSNNSDYATITASVLDGNNSPVSGASVTFTSTGGQITSTTVDTDSTGQASTLFRSGNVNKSNQTVTITATVTGVSAVQIPIQITGSTVTLSTNSTTITSDGSTTAQLTVTALDSTPSSVYNTAVTLSVSGGATLSSYTGNTDINGQLTVTVTGTSAGSVTVTATALGATATQDYTVSVPAGAFGITSPTSDPASLKTSGAGSSLVVSVNAPSSANVVFVTSVGVWDGGSSTTTKAVAGGVVSATLTSTLTGVANVMVYDAADTSTTDSISVAISAPSSAAATIDLQASPTVVPPSIGGTSYTSGLRATVRTATGQVVGDAAVAFSIVSPTGGGETISPVVAFTDSSGTATATFTSGSLSSISEGVIVSAEIIGSTITPDTVNIVIGGTAGSVVIGQSTEIKENDTKTYYIYPMSVLVADSNGNPVSGADITLKIWPVQYTTDGTLDGVYGTFTNEDGDENLIMIGTEDLDCDGVLDAGEDANGNAALDRGEDFNCDGQLTPPNSAGGTLPATVTTDSSGVANFDLTYLKQSSRWITARLDASAMVQGTETKSTITFTLPPSQTDVEAGTLPSSPYFAPLTGVPTSITLAGAAGSTVSSALLSPSFGSPPYTFKVGLGTMTPDNGLTSTYSYTIPVGSSSGSLILDTITVKDSAVPSSSVTIDVTINVL